MHLDLNSNYSLVKWCDNDELHLKSKGNYGINVTSFQEITVEFDSYKIVFAYPNYKVVITTEEKLIDGLKLLLKELKENKNFKCVIRFILKNKNQSDMIKALINKIDSNSDFAVMNTHDDDGDLYYSLYVLRLDRFTSKNIKIKEAGFTGEIVAFLNDTHGFHYDKYGLFGINIGVIVKILKERQQITDEEVLEYCLKYGDTITSYLIPDK